MSDKKFKKKNEEKTRIKLKEQRRQEPEDAIKGEEVKEIKTINQNTSSRQQLDLFHFYKKRVRERDYLAHATQNVGTNTDLQTSDDVSMNSEVGKVLVNDGGLTMGSAHLTGSVVNDDATLLSTCQDSKMMSGTCTDIPHTSYPKHQDGTCAMPNGLSHASSILPSASVSEVIATEECMDQSTDEGSIDQGQSNTSMAPSITLFKPINQEIPTQCAALSQLPLLSHTPQNRHLPFLLNRSPSHPSQRPLFLTTDLDANNSTSLIDNNRKEETNAEGALNKSGVIDDGNLLAIRKCQMPGDKLFSKEATLDSSISHYDTAIVSSVPEPASEYGQVFEQASEHGSEKETRCDRLGTEEASESICTASQNVNANGPGVEDNNAIKSIPILDRFMEGGESIITPIDLTRSPRPEHGPLTNFAVSSRTRYELISLSQEDSLPNEIRASGSRFTTLPGTIASHGRITSPILGSQDKPIEVEVLSPARLAGEIKPSSHPQFKPSSNRATFRKSQQSPLQIHPFFQRTTTTATLAVNSGRDADIDVGLGINLDFSSTAHANQDFGSSESASFRSDVRKAKGNKDKSSDEAQCDITGVDADVIFTRSTSEKNRFWDFISKPTNSTSSSNAIRTTATSPPFSKTRALLTPWPNSENQHVLKSQRLAAIPSPFPKCMAKRRGADEIGIEGLLDEQLGLNRKHVPINQELLLVRPSLHIPHRSAIRDALEAIPSEHQDHPGISRVVSVIKEKGKERRAEENTDTPRGHGLWTTKWKPRRAAEVLGNESQALYLREWLKALSIQGLTVEKAKPWEKENVENKKHKRKRKVEEQSQKRRMVIRSIKKGKRRRIESDEDQDEDTNWIVADDEDDEINGNAGGNADDRLPNAGKLPGNDCNDREDFEMEFSKRLTNTILIAGKPGTGKTSAVYACAVELGWEIFEVYPGIGKRAGMNVAELVGSVGKNHIVGKGVRQSIILLEEVDILFKEDLNFGQAW